MYGLGRVVREYLIDIFERAPDAFSDGEEDRDLLGRSEEVVQASTGERQIDSGGNGRTMTKDLSDVGSVMRIAKGNLILTFKSSSVGIS